MEMSAFSHGWDRAQDSFHMPVRSFEEHPLSSLADRSVSRNDDVRWDHEAARLSLHRHVMDHLASPDAVLVLDESDFAKESGRYVGAQRVHDSDGGRAEHRQTGVFLAYSAPRGEGYLDRELFLPKAWTEHEALRLASGVPSDVAFVTRSEMARRMLERSLNAGVPHRFVAGGVTFGTDAGLRLWLEERRESYVLGVPGREHVSVGAATHRADALVAGWPDEAWRCASGADADATASLWAGVQLICRSAPDWERWLLVRRTSWDRPAYNYHVAFVPAQTRFDEMVAAMMACRKVAAGIRDARRDVGLDRFSGRSWDGWYRHMTVALMAHSVLSLARSTRSQRAKSAPAPVRQRAHQSVFLNRTRWSAC